MKSFIQTGANITVVAPSTISSGEGVLIGSLFGIANGAADTSADMVLSTTGVFEMTKEVTDVVAVGDPIYWDNAAKVVTVDDATGANAKIGVAVTDAANPSNDVRIRLNGAF